MMENKEATVSLERAYPSLNDLKRKARKRVPRFAYDYLSGGIGSHESCLARNRQALDSVQLSPLFLNGVGEANLKTTLLGRTFDAPFGVAPVGLTGLIWPRAAEMIAGAASRRNVPFVLSTVATTSIEVASKTGGKCTWFQLYAPNDTDVMDAMLDRVENAGIDVLVVSVDIPVRARRERDMRNGLSVPPKFGLSALWDMLSCPVWALAVLKSGPPNFENLAPHFPEDTDLQQVAHALSTLLHGPFPQDRLARIRDRWKGSLVVKGVMSVEDATICASTGADAIVVSNHGGRQSDAAPSPLSVLSQIRATVGNEIPLILDSGVESGLDIARALAVGADFVLLGRAFLYGVAALGSKGADHVMHLLYEELRTNLIQNGCSCPQDLPGRLYKPSTEHLF